MTQMQGSLSHVTECQAMQSKAKQSKSVTCDPFPFPLEMRKTPYGDRAGIILFPVRAQAQGSLCALQAEVFLLG